MEALPYAADLCAAVSEIEMESAVQRYNCYIKGLTVIKLMEG